PQPRAVHQTTQPPSAWRAIPPACAANRRGCSSSSMAIARMRRACLASAVRAASARNCEILRSWRVISIADMLPAPRINDMLHRVTFATAWESPTSQVLGRLVLLGDDDLPGGGNDGFLEGPFNGHREIIMEFGKGRRAKRFV